MGRHFQYHFYMNSKYRTSGQYYERIEEMPSQDYYVKMDCIQ